MIEAKGDQKCVGPVVDVRSFQKDGKEYIVVSCTLIRLRSSFFFGCVVF